MDDRILDEDSFKEEGKDESISNRRIALIRYFLCIMIALGWMYNLKTIYTYMQPFGTEDITFLIGYVSALLFFIGFVYYNIKQANVERTSSYVKPFFKKPFIILFLFYTGFLIGSNVRNIFYLLNTNIGLYIPVVPLVFRIVLLAILFRREFIYFRRRSTISIRK